MPPTKIGQFLLIIEIMRTKYAFSKKDFCKRCNITPDFYRKILNNQRYPSMEVLELMLESVGMELNITFNVNDTISKAKKEGEVEIKPVNGTLLLMIKGKPTAVKAIDLVRKLFGNEAADKLMVDNRE